MSRRNTTAAAAAAKVAAQPGVSWEATLQPQAAVHSELREVARPMSTPRDWQSSLSL
jgi:hypothetical protein